jgi:2-C-methyl-D-erythritol 4-phosphate cytidylyltransferase
MSLIEKYHPEIEINLVKADEEIYKVTTPKDYEIAKEIWRKKL